MARVPVVSMLVALALCAGCSGDLKKRTADLEEKNRALAAKLVAAEAENARLKQQIELLTSAADDLANVRDAQKAAGADPKRPAPSPSPSPVSTKS